MRLTLSIFTTTLIGFNILYLIAPRAPLYRAERLALSYGVGLGFVTLQMLLFYIFKKEFSLTAILAPWPILLLITLVIYLKDKDKRARNNRIVSDRTIAPIRYPDILLAFGILFEVFYAFFRALIKPLEAYDAIAIYGIKAKAFFLANTLPQHFFDNSSFVFPHADYPLNMPLAETLTYFFLGGLNDQLVKVIFPLYFLAILTLVYFFMRRFAGRTYSLLFTFILATIPQFTAQSTSGYIDVPFGYYASAAMLLLFLWFKDAGQRGLLWLSAVAAGLGAWTKNEGLMYCVINAVLLAIFFTLERRTVLPRKQFLYLAGYIGIMVLVNIPWFYVKGLRHLLNSEINLADLNPENIFHNAGRIWPITYEFQKQFLGPKKWNIIWILLAAAFVAKIRRAFTGELRYMSLAILLAFCGYTAVYLITLSDVSWHLSSAASRILLHFLPVAVCWLAVALKEEIRI